MKNITLSLYYGKDYESIGVAQGHDSVAAVELPPAFFADGNTALINLIDAIGSITGNQEGDIVGVIQDKASDNLMQINPPSYYMKPIDDITISVILEQLQLLSSLLGTGQKPYYNQGRESSGIYFTEFGLQNTEDYPIVGAKFDHEDGIWTYEKDTSMFLDGSDVIENSLVVIRAVAADFKLK